MRTISYDSTRWDAVWDRLAKDYSAFGPLGTSLGFSIRKQVELIQVSRASKYKRITIHLDFELDEDYTLFVLKYR